VKSAGDIAEAVQDKSRGYM